MEKTKMEEIMYKKQSSYEKAPEKTEQAFDFAKGYMAFLDNAKTEREAVTEAIRQAEACSSTVTIATRAYISSRLAPSRSKTASVSMPHISTRREST